MRPHTFIPERPIRAAFALFFLGFLFVGCDKNEPPSTPSGQVQNYEIRGLLLEKKADGAVIVVKHEDVPGFMPSMTMPFDLKNASESAPFHVGDALSFTLVVEPEQALGVNLQSIDPATLKLPATKSRATSPPLGARLKEGHTWPDFSLVDQNEQPISASTFRGSYVLLNFIFVRCPIPNYCPLVTGHFAQIQAAVAADAELVGKFRQLSVSIDPEDRPEILRQYGAAFSKDPNSWLFATGVPEQVEKLTHAFSVRVETEGGTINHGLCTALIDPEGKVLQLWRGNGWTPAEVLEALNALN